MMHKLPRKTAWLAAGFACLAGLSLSGCDSKEPAGKSPTLSSASSAAGETASSIAIVELAESDVVSVRAGDIEQSLRANGTLHAVQESLVRSKVTGEVNSVAVREGEHVSAGQELARIDDLEYKARLDDRHAALEAGRAQAALAESTRSKNEELLQKKFLSSLAYDNAKSASSVASSQVQSLQAQLTLAEKALQDTVVRAPISGWIAERSVQRGDKTSPDGKLFTIVDLSHLELEALVPANEVSRVAIGQTFTTSVEGFADKRFTGHVSRIGAQAIPGSRAVTIYIAIANPDAALKAGLFAEGTLSLGRSKARALVPLTALRSEAGSDFVYAIENGQIKRLQVEIGMQSEAAGLAEIRKGVDAGMQVVAVNLGPLKEGASVKLVSTSPAVAKGKAADTAETAETADTASTRTQRNR